VLMAPVAFFARVTSTVAGLALARVLTAVASAACVPLAGNLVRYRGTLVTALTCFILAIYPSDIATAHTLLLEPWMNLLCLTGANLAFSRGRLAARTSRLAWAGIVIGFAGAVKFWSAAPAAVLLVCCLVDREPGWRRRIVACASGVIGAFAVTLLPFVLSAPGTFVRSTVVYQAARVGTYTPLSLRLAHITGLIDVLDYWSRLTLTAGANSLFGQAVDADTAPAVPHLLPYLAAALLVVVVLAGYWLGRRELLPAEWFSLATAALALLAILWYSAFFYHYPAFPAPWLAIVGAVAIARLIARVPSVTVRQVAIGFLAFVMICAAVLQIAEVAPLHTPPGTAQFEALIPAGACVVTDEVALTIAANRFEAAKPGCPVVIDSLATTLVLTHGISDQGGADRNPAAQAGWQQILTRAQYVWLSPNVWRRLPWRAGYPPAWFTADFRQIWPRTGWVRGLGNLYVRR
jgi:hypothetical protein